MSTQAQPLIYLGLATQLGPNPAPTLSSISPTSATQGDPDTVVTLTGTNFNLSTVAKLAGVALATTFVSKTSVTAVVPSGSLLATGTPSVTAVNSTPGGGTSGGKTFTISAVSASLPTPASQTIPGNPASWGDTVNATFSGALVANAPQIAQWTRQGQKGDSINVTGTFAADATFKVLGQTTSGNGVIAVPTVVRIVANRAVLSLPSSLPPNAMYFLYAIDNAGKIGAPVPINMAELWWYNGATTGNVNVMVGDTINLFGRNLSSVIAGNSAVPYDGSSPNLKCQIYIVATYAAQNFLLFATCTAINPYRAQFVMPTIFASTTSATSLTLASAGQLTLTTASAMSYPTGLPLFLSTPSAGDGSGGWMSGTVDASSSGTTLVVNLNGGIDGSGGPFTSWLVDPAPQISMYVHNGHGGIYGFSNPIVIGNILTKQYLRLNYDKKVVTLGTPNGDATGAMDSAMFTAAVAAAGNSQASLRFPAGVQNYVINQQIFLSAGGGEPVQLLGTGAANTKITASGTFMGTNMIGGAGEINSLTLDTNGQNLQCGNRAINCTLINLLGGTIVQIGGVTNAYLTGCTITGGIAMENCGSFYCDSCVIFGASQSNGPGLIYLGGGSNIQVTNTTGQLLAAQHLAGRFVLSTIEHGTQRNYYCDTLTTPSGLAGQSSGSQDAEIFFTESPSGSSSSGVTAATSSTVTIYSTQAINIDATGGTFTLTFNGHTTAAIACNASAAAVKSALVAADCMLTADVIVRWGYFQDSADAPGNQFPIIIEFSGALTGAQPLITGGWGSLTGGGATGSIVSLISTNWNGVREATITDGTGAGQSLQITGVNTGTNQLTLAGTWDVIPDTSSRINVVATYVNRVIYNCQVTGGYPAEGFAGDDSMGYSTYGGGINNIVDGSAFNGCIFGASVRVQTGDYCMAPLFAPLFQNNTYDTCWQAARLGLITSPTATTENATAIFFCGMHRNERFTNIGDSGIFIQELDGPNDLETWQDCTINGEKYGVNWPGSLPSVTAVNIFLVNTGFTGNNAAGSMGMRGVQPFVIGASAFTNFQTVGP